MTTGVRKRSNMLGYSDINKPQSLNPRTSASEPKPQSLRPEPLSLRIRIG